MNSALAFICTVFLLITSPEKQEQWQEKINKNDVAVFVRSGTGKVLSVKSVFSVNAPMEKVRDMILGVAAYPEWIYRCSRAEVLKQISPKELYFYQITSAPWPVKDRDLISHVTVLEKNGEITIINKAEPGYMPKKKDMIRVTMFDSVWRLKQAGKKVEVINEISTDPGGDVPAWLINMVIAQGPYESSLNLKQRAEK